MTPFHFDQPSQITRISAQPAQAVQPAQAAVLDRKSANKTRSVSLARRKLWALGLGLLLLPLATGLSACRPKTKNPSLTPMEPPTVSGERTSEEASTEATEDEKASHDLEKASQEGTDTNGDATGETKGDASGEDSSLASSELTERTLARQEGANGADFKSLVDLTKGTRELSVEELQVKIDQVPSSYVGGPGEPFAPQNTGDGSQSGLVRLPLSFEMTNTGSFPLVRFVQVVEVVDPTTNQSKTYTLYSTTSILPGEKSLSIMTPEASSVVVRGPEDIHTKEIRYTYYDRDRQSLTDVTYDPNTQTYTKKQEQALKDRLPNPAVAASDLPVTHLSTDLVPELPGYAAVSFTVTNASSSPVPLFMGTFLNRKTQQIIHAGTYQMVAPGAVSEPFQVTIPATCDAADLILLSTVYRYMDGQGTHQVCFDDRVGIPIDIMTVPQ